MRTLAIVAILASFLTACGSAAGSTFPEETECGPPEPLPTSSRTPGTVSMQVYVARARMTATTIAQLRADLRAKYPDNTFYRRDAFRPDFLAYADQTICAAEEFLQLGPTPPALAQYDANLDRALTDLVEHTRFGREAVRRRNVSEYRDWFKDADNRVSAVQMAAFAQR